MFYQDNLKYEDFGTAVETSVSVLTTTTQVLAANSGRQFVFVENISDTNIAISLGNSATLTGINSGIKLSKFGSAGNSFSLKDGSIYTGAIYGKAPTTGKLLSVIYYNRGSSI